MAFRTGRIRHPFRAVACLSRQTQGAALCCHIAPFQGWQSAKFGYVQKTPLQKASGYSSPERVASNCDGHRPSIKNASTNSPERVIYQLPNSVL